ncbi:MAG: hypothetical protein K8J31_06685 [Anaerolineae bacterium]|nr:hypothetical protein [Anaerolineae bacterium]
MSSTYLKSLAQRALGETPVVRPQQPPLFAPRPVLPEADVPETTWQERADTPSVSPISSPLRTEAMPSLSDHAQPGDRPRPAATIPVEASHVPETTEPRAYLDESEPSLPLVEETVQAAVVPVIPPRLRVEPEERSQRKQTAVPRVPAEPPSAVPAVSLARQRRENQTGGSEDSPRTPPPRPTEITAPPPAPTLESLRLVPEFRPSEPTSGTPAPIQTDAARVEPAERDTMALPNRTQPDRSRLVPAEDAPVLPTSRFEERAVPPAASTPSDAEPDTIRIHIGRIDVRATIQPKPEAARPQRPAPRMSLDDYLRAQNGRKP